MSFIKNEDRTSERDFESFTSNRINEVIVGQKDNIGIILQLFTDVKRAAFVFFSNTDQILNRQRLIHKIRMVFHIFQAKSIKNLKIKKEKNENITLDFRMIIAFMTDH